MSSLTHKVVERTEAGLAWVDELCCYFKSVGSFPGTAKVALSWWRPITPYCAWLMGHVCKLATSQPRCPLRDANCLVPMSPHPSLAQAAGCRSLATVWKSVWFVYTDQGLATPLASELRSSDAPAHSTQVLVDIYSCAVSLWTRVPSCLPAEALKFRNEWVDVCAFRWPTPTSAQRAADKIHTDPCTWLHTQACYVGLLWE